MDIHQIYVFHFLDACYISTFLLPIDIIWSPIWRQNTIFERIFQPMIAFWNVDLVSLVGDFLSRIEGNGNSSSNSFHPSWTMSSHSGEKPLNEKLFYRHNKNTCSNLRNRRAMNLFTSIYSIFFTSFDASYISTF